MDGTGGRCVLGAEKLIIKQGEQASLAKKEEAGGLPPLFLDISIALMSLRHYVEATIPWGKTSKYEDNTSLGSY